MPVGGAHIPRVIPPLGAKARVVEVIAREIVTVAGEGVQPGDGQQETGEHGYLQVSTDGRLKAMRRRRGGSYFRSRACSSRLPSCQPSRNSLPALRISRPASLAPRLMSWA